MMFDPDKALAEEIGSYSQNEWAGSIGGQPITLYAKPITPADMEFLRRKGHSDFMSSPDLVGMSRMVIRKAVGENGKAVFAEAKHLPLFSRMDATKIGEIFGALFGQQFEPIDDDSGHEARVGK